MKASYELIKFLLQKCPKDGMRDSADTLCDSGGGTFANSPLMEVYVLTFLWCCYMQLSSGGDEANLKMKMELKICEVLKIGPQNQT